jgi:hypothetical protein
MARALVPSGGLRPVEGAIVELLQQDAILASTITDDDGKFRFERLDARDYALFGSKQDIGETQRSAVLPPEHGVEIDLILRPAPRPRMFVKVPLDDGFAIRGNPEYTGPLRQIRVRMAYAAWGGSKSFTEADFSLDDAVMQISFSGVAELQRDELVAAANVLRFTPVTNEFYVEVRGFDPNRALHADVRALEDGQVEQEAPA